MAVKDLRSNVIAQYLGTITNLGADTTTAFTGVIDNAPYELGIFVSVIVTGTDGAAAVTLVFQESNDPTFATFDTVTSTSDKYIGAGTVTVSAASAVPTATASLTTENRLFTAGIFSNKRYLRAALVDVGGGDTADAIGFAVQSAENLPTVAPDA